MSNIVRFSDFTKKKIVVEMIVMIMMVRRPNSMSCTQVVGQGNTLFLVETSIFKNAKQNTHWSTIIVITSHTIIIVVFR